MRLLRIIRSTPVYLLMILAVVIYALVWAYRVNATIPLDGMTRNVAIAAIAVILWGRIRNLMIRIHPLKGESIPADKWILQLFPRLLVIAIIWLAAEAQPVEPRADFTLAAVAACAILGTRALWIWNFFLGPFVALLGGALAFLAEAYYQPTDQQLAIVGGLLALVGIEAVVDKVFFRVQSFERIKYDEVAAREKEQERSARQRGEWAEKFAQNSAEFYEKHPELEDTPELEELRTQIRLRGYEDMVRERGIRPGVDFPISAVPDSALVYIRSTRSDRERGKLQPHTYQQFDPDGSIRVIQMGTERVGRARWTLQDLERWKKQWIEEYSRGR